MRILFVSRAFPPVVGGIENQNHALFCHLDRIARVTLLANTRGKRFLPLFLPYALCRCLFLARKHDVILLGDGVLAVVGWWIRWFARAPTACVLHGLDLTFANPVYQALWIRRFLPKVDALFPVSRETAEVAARKGLRPSRCHVIPNGVDPEAFSGKLLWAELEALAGRPLRDCRLLLTLGRLVERKGVEWFVRNVMPRLDSDIVYLVAGEGPMRPRITEAVHQLGLASRVMLLGKVSDPLRRTLYQVADVFVQPNIPVAGDMEGFGLVVLEAAAAGAPVVASRLEGLQDAVRDGESGMLVAPGDVEGFVAAIHQLTRDPAYREAFGRRARACVLSHYHWSAIAERYLRACQTLLPVDEKSTDGLG